MRIVLLIFLIVSPLIVQAEKLFIIEHVSNEKTIFTINHGLTDGIIAGQKSLFTTDNFSLAAVATKVTRFYSIWRPISPGYLVPFIPGQTVMFNQSRHGIYREIPQLALEYKKISEYKKKLKLRKRSFHKYSVSFSNISGLTESTSTVDQVDQFTRLGQHYSFFYNYKVTASLALNIGARYDAESLKISNPALTIPVTRMMGLIGATYYFNGSNPVSSYYTYFRFSLGYGQAKSNVSGYKVTGNSLIFPNLSFGVELKLNTEYSLVLELGAEALKTDDIFESGEGQQNIQTAMLLTGGLNF